MQKYSIQLSGKRRSGEASAVLTMERGQTGTILLDLSTLEQGPGELVVELPDTAVYELLEGKDQVVRTRGAVVKLSPRVDELVIEHTPEGGETAQYRASLQDVALAWNMIAGQGHRDSG